MLDMRLRGAVLHRPHWRIAERAEAHLAFPDRRAPHVTRSAAGTLFHLRRYGRFLTPPAGVLRTPSTALKSFARASGRYSLARERSPAPHPQFDNGLEIVRC